VRPFDEAVTRITTGLQAPLPGRAAQGVMMPRPPREWPEGFNPARIRNAAGLLLLFPIAGAPHIILTVRSDSLERHGGQVSLPGGVVDPGETFEQAALREAHEEVNLARSSVKVLGALTPVDIHVSGFRLHPIVGAAIEQPDLRPADREVARILEVPLFDLMRPESVVWRTFTRDNRSVRVPVFLAAGAELWGATAMVVSELLVLLGWDGQIAECT
jgi:8-oxo-dGTP pyrophosphatase MutT (NUDIX family)